MKLAFVPPRFGPGVFGGSEALSREAAAGFAARGHDVEVVTTCAVDHYTWANELPEGTSSENGLIVRRFPTLRHPSRPALRAQLAIQAGRVPDLDHQVSWMGFLFSVPALFEFLLREGRNYDAVIFSPYLFWTTSVCVPLVAERAVVMPCLHDETYARLDVLRPVLGNPALVWFLSAPEHALGHRLGPVARRHSVTGAGVPVPTRYDPEGFMKRHGLERPFVLHAGRREEGKGLEWLLDAFSTAVVDEGLDLDLVSIGKGELGLPLRAQGALAERVIDLGFVTDEERDDAFAAAAAYVQTSQVESFSRTIMEAWLAGTPVLAWDRGEVVAWHCRRSGGGLLFGDASELAEQLRVIVEKPDVASELAAAGRRYVLENYSWPSVLDRMEASLRATFE
ncbi:MAG TPA: glycosyltransferase [Acidimicrobiales bacterium]|nr:glycosyltransferase [Acidimicrobiales bacterium]